MKHYFYTVRSTPKKLWNNYVLKLYQIKNNTPIYIWEREYNLWAMKWHEHEAMDILLAKKHITKNDYAMSKTSWRWSWYYVDNKKFIIHIL